MKHIRGLRIDLDLISGGVDLPAEFRYLGALARADVLRDWMHDLNLEYERAISEMRLHGPTYQTAIEDWDNPAGSAEG